MIQEMPSPRKTLTAFEPVTLPMAASAVGSPSAAEREARALEEADYRQRPLDSPDDADYMQSQVDQQLAEEGERAKDVWREDAEHVGWETLNALDGTERDPWFVKPDEHELGKARDELVQFQSAWENQAQLQARARTPRGSRSQTSC